jgi:hypothetical protein
MISNPTTSHGSKKEGKKDAVPYISFNPINHHTRTLTTPTGTRSYYPPESDFQHNRKRTKERTPSPLTQTTDKHANRKPTTLLSHSFFNPNNSCTFLFSMATRKLQSKTILDSLLEQFSEEQLMFFSTIRQYPAKQFCQQRRLTPLLFKNTSIALFNQ